MEKLDTSSENLLLQNSFYHYKYTRTAQKEVSLGKRTKTECFIIATDRAASGYEYLRHTIILPVSAIGNFYKNLQHTLVREQRAGQTKLLFSTQDNGHYVSLIITGDKPVYTTARVDFSADEYKYEPQTNEYTSDLFLISGINFSIRVPANINNDTTQTNAVLTLIRDGEVITVNPYSFTENKVLKKLNTLPVGNEVDILFQLK